jgi:Domain of unknown function (DU1801)
VQSTAATVQQYLDSLPEDRRACLSAVRKVFRDNLDDVYEEGMQYGMIGYYVPHSYFPPGYHCDPKQPLPFGGIASQKSHMSIHMMPVYGNSKLNEWFQKAWAMTGKKLDMGKACVRFKKLEDLALDVIGEAIRRVPAKKYIAFCEAVLQSMKKRRTAGRARSHPASKPVSRAKSRRPARKM